MKPFELRKEPFFVLFFSAIRLCVLAGVGFNNSELFLGAKKNIFLG